MLCENCSCELGKPGKRRSEERNSTTNTNTTTDRLSHLPDPILHHILSFLDTKSAVRTSKLSRSWRSVWKHVPVLDLRVSSFRSACRFETFASKVLSRRYPLKLRKVTYVHNVGPWDEDHKKRFVKVINYAFSHDVEELVLDTGSKRPDELKRSFRLSSLFHSNPMSDNRFVMKSSSKSRMKISSFSLKTLELTYIALDNEFLLGAGTLPVLTTLKATKMGRYTIKALPLENGWEFVEPPMHLFMGHQVHMFMGDRYSTIKRLNKGRFAVGADAELAQWDKVLDYVFKESSCEEPHVVVDFGGSNFVRKIL